jgi:fructuronate reductase
VSDALPRLSYAQLPVVAERYRPSIDPRDRTVRIVHLGIGAFHRSHQAYYTELSGDWGICGVTQRSRRVVDQLEPQDGLYTLVEKGGAEPILRIIGAVREVMFGGADRDAVVRRIADPAVGVVTLTVTEKGYRYDPSTSSLLLDDPEIAADLAGRPPQTVIGQLAASIAVRAATAGPPLTVLSCDNVPSNGQLLAGLVRTFSQHASHTKQTVDWLDEHVTFPGTMVDRIVPATTDADRALVAAALHLDDRGTVVAEPFTQWVIEDRFAGDRPPWELAGALMVDRVAPYEKMKIRLLNGSHSALAYLGGLAGYETIADAITDSTLADYVRALMRYDVLPTLTMPAGIDPEQYQASVLDRFANPALDHRTVQIAMDGSHKLPQRLLDTIRERRASGGEPIYATLGVAAWMRHIVDAVAHDGTPFPPDDPLIDVFRERVSGEPSPQRIVDGLLLPSVFAELVDDEWFRRCLTQLVGQLKSHATTDVVRALLVAHQ